ncbi:hypothetical protein [Nocardia sp. NBC_01388]|uniref:hypothetical protein n=1 Tax=Nocardia sp. NBC_01388 TaxID=2903596 RepID=UPI00324C483B
MIAAAVHPGPALRQHRRLGGLVHAAGIQFAAGAVAARAAGNYLLHHLDDAGRSPAWPVRFRVL